MEKSGACSHIEYDRKPRVRQSGNKRFNDIANSIPHITNRVLSKELKNLEAN
ncbi:winged helix-turn-helix transcriptional regulator [Dyadobacter subterraneus]|uniref:winged helix-turn-helix transcriptional regulator n=1 Tax=Dyadobacter subterraneus TaxID=2773304 RepID=UPI00286D86B0|nr:winged helix-turn-helix transcriptional regulator [Dyadobacter subterraneus]